MSGRYAGKTAVVSGAASGIGEAVARRLASEGASVVALDIDERGASRVAAEIGGRAHAIDVSSPASVAAAFKAIDVVDLLVNSAGIVHVGDVLATSVEDFDRVHAVNARGTFLTMQAALPGMIEKGGGAIVNLASIASKIGLADRFAYSMSKGAVLTMTLSVARDFVSRNIRANCVCPARVHTPLVEGFLAKNYPDRREEMFQELSSHQPIGRMGRAEEVAGLIAYLGSDEAAFITGSAYDIDGGVTLLR